MKQFFRLWWDLQKNIFSGIILPYKNFLQLAKDKFFLLLCFIFPLAAFLLIFFFVLQVPQIQSILVLPDFKNISFQELISFGAVITVLLFFLLLFFYWTTYIYFGWLHRIYYAFQSGDEDFRFRFSEVFSWWNIRFFIGLTNRVGIFLFFPFLFGVLSLFGATYLTKHYGGSEFLSWIILGLIILSLLYIIYRSFLLSYVFSGGMTVWGDGSFSSKGVITLSLDELQGKVLRFFLGIFPGILFIFFLDVGYQFSIYSLSDMRSYNYVSQEFAKRADSNLSDKDFLVQYYSEDVIKVLSQPDGLLVKDELLAFLQELPSSKTEINKELFQSTIHLLDTSLIDKNGVYWESLMQLFFFLGFGGLTMSLINALFLQRNHGYFHKSYGIQVSRNGYNI